MSDDTGERRVGVRARLAELSSVTILDNAPLASFTRFGLGGPADLLVDTCSAESFSRALHLVRSQGVPFTVIGGGSNLIVADEGFRGVILRYTASSIEADGARVRADAGAVLQALVDFTVTRSLRGLETMTGIPGWVGAAVYGNAGAYGHSISERVREVRFHDGSTIRTADRAGCEFRYRESVFKRRKDWIILDAVLDLDTGDSGELAATASGILNIRNEKYPPTMKCAGSIFKNLILAELPAAVQAQIPERVVREGKVPSAWFLEQVGAKGESIGDIHVATYHANLIFNGGQGTARDLCRMIQELKGRVRERFSFDLEEEVQYVGFGSRS